MMRKLLALMARGIALGIFAMCILLALCFAKILFALRVARFPAATTGPSRLSLHPRAPRISPRGTPTRYTCIYEGWRNADVFATLGCFGLGSPIVPVVQPSQSHMRKDFGAFLHTRRVFMRLPVFPTGIRCP